MFLVLIFLVLISASSLSESVGHVVIFASPLFGHIIPLLDLAQKFSMHHHVTYVVSASLLDELERRGIISNNDEKNSTMNQFEIEFIGLFDGNIFGYEVN